MELTVQFLQLLHGAELPSVRVTGTLEAITQLAQQNCLTQQEASILSENHARSVGWNTTWPSSSNTPFPICLKRNLYWIDWLGDSAFGTSPEGTHSSGDGSRFEEKLQEIYEINRKIINHLMTQETGEGRRLKRN